MAAATSPRSFGTTGKPCRSAERSQETETGGIALLMPAVIFHDRRYHRRRERCGAAWYEGRGAERPDDAPLPLVLPLAATAAVGRQAG